MRVLALLAVEQVSTGHFDWGDFFLGFGSGAVIWGVFLITRLIRGSGHDPKDGEGLRSFRTIR